MKRQLGLVSVLALAALVGGVRPARAQEWTRFRGPNGTGISSATTVPVNYTAADLNWRGELPGKGHSAPGIWGDRLFVTSADENQRYLLCLSTKDGHTLWSKSYPYS